MPIEPAVAARLCSRFAQFVSWRCCDDEARVAVIACLAEAAQSDDHARRMVDLWCRTQTDAPVEAQVWELAGRVEVSSAGPPPARGCRECGGSGYRQVFMLVTYARHPSGAIQRGSAQRLTPAEYENLRSRVDGRCQEVFSAAEPCACDYGLHLGQMRLARQAQDADEAPTGRGRRR